VTACLCRRGVSKPTEQNPKFGWVCRVNAFRFKLARFRRASPWESRSPVLGGSTSYDSGFLCVTSSKRQVSCVCSVTASHFQVSSCTVPGTTTLVVSTAVKE
jgi:hypothetical protein